MAEPSNIKKYIDIERWASRRYTTGGHILHSVGSTPSTYKLIEDIAAAKYLGCARRHPNHNLATSIRHRSAK